MYSRLVLTVLLVPLLASAAGSGGTAPKRAPAPRPLTREEERAIDVVYVRRTEEGYTGGISKAKVRVKPNPSQDVRVAVYEEFSGGAGPQWRASVWMASFLASTLMERSLTEHEFSVSVGGFVDGPSAGALTTAAVLAAMNGVPLRPEVTMTGTINPDGTVGPVGGIPHKLRGAAAAGKKVFGFPLGERFDMDMTKRESVDLVGLGEELKVKVVEVRDIFEAYELLTGQKLARPTSLPEDGMELSPVVFKRKQAQIIGWMSRARSNAALIEQAHVPLKLVDVPLTQAKAAGALAERYQQQGLIAPAHAEAFKAAAFTELSRVLSKLSKLGIEGDSQGIQLEVASLQQVNGELEALLARLEAEPPDSVPAALHQLDAYDDVNMARACIELAQQGVARFGKAQKSGAFEEEKDETRRAMLVLSYLTQPTLYYTLARFSIESAREALSMPVEATTPTAFNPAELARVARTFAAAAKANLDYYDAIILKEQADAQNASLAAAQAAKAQQDTQYMLAYKLVGYATANAEGQSVEASLVQLSAARHAYVLAARLVAAEYSLEMERHKDGSITLGRDKALIAMLELGAQRAREAAMRAKERVGTVPEGARVSYQLARIRREGTAEDKLLALQNFWESTSISQMALALQRAVGPLPRAAGPVR